MNKSDGARSHVDRGQLFGMDGRGMFFEVPLTELHEEARGSDEIVPVCGVAHPHGPDCYADPGL